MPLLQFSSKLFVTVKCKFFEATKNLGLRVDEMASWAEITKNIFFYKLIGEI